MLPISWIKNGYTWQCFTIITYFPDTGYFLLSLYNLETVKWKYTWFKWQCINLTSFSIRHIIYLSSKLWVPTITYQHCAGMNESGPQKCLETVKEDVHQLQFAVSLAIMKVYGQCCRGIYEWLILPQKEKWKMGGTRWEKVWSNWCFRETTTAAVQSQADSTFCAPTLHPGILREHFKIPAAVSFSEDRWVCGDSLWPF